MAIAQRMNAEGEGHAADIRMDLGLKIHMLPLMRGIARGCNYSSEQAHLLKEILLESILER
jgi:hypothetical protein